MSTVNPPAAVLTRRFGEGARATIVAAAVSTSLVAATLPAPAFAADCLSSNPVDWPVASRPYVLVAVSTSASLASPVATANACAFENTLLGHTRCALKRAFQSYAGRVNFGLASSARTMAACASSCFTNCAYGDHAGNAAGDATLCPSGAGCGAEPDPTAPGSSSRAGGRIVVPIAADSGGVNTANVSDMVSWVDGTCDEQKELFANGCTPLNGMLRDVYRYLSGSWTPPGGTAVPSPLTSLASGERACRAIEVILLTAGVEACDTEADAVSAAASLLSGFTKDGLTWKARVHVVAVTPAAVAQADLIAAAGGTGAAYVAANDVQVLTAIGAIVEGAVKPELCDNVDNDCNGCTDEGYRHFANVQVDPAGCKAAATPAQRQTALANYKNSITTANPKGNVKLLPCTPITMLTEPASWLCFDPGETCDFIDNNGDGKSDEGITKCGSTLHCPQAEVCDGQDNDCDGLIDEDALCLGCIPTAEVCDGCDNDCNGMADDGVAPTQCGLSTPGNCVGFLACKPPQTVPVGGCVASGGWGACSNAPQGETCDGLDNDCDGVIDDGVDSVPCVPAGSPIDLGFGGTSQCKKGWQTCGGACAGFVGPSTEVCDGIDNNCNDKVDEDVPGVGQPCGSDVLPCVAGKTACVGGKLVCQGGVATEPERCDGIDNDCDGHIDEAPLADAPLSVQQGCWALPGNCCTFGGLSWCPPANASCNGAGSLKSPCHAGTIQCTSGTWACVGPSVPAPETCDGIDNDCSGLADDGVLPQVGQSCGVASGQCTEGTLACESGQLACSGQGVSTELCDGVDNDCDGQTDEGIATGTPCQAPVDGAVFPGNRTGGACRAGVATCQQGGTVTCLGAVGPTAEVCNGVDDDCDGQTDEAGTAPDGLDASTGPDGHTLGTACGAIAGVCTPVTWQCAAGMVRCVGATAGLLERCNGLDDNCNGSVDEGTELCPPGSTCAMAGGLTRCAAACTTTSDCALGQACVPGTSPTIGSWCVPSPDASCPASGPPGPTGPTGPQGGNGTKPGAGLTSTPSEAGTDGTLPPLVSETAAAGGAAPEAAGCNSTSRNTGGVLGLLGLGALWLMSRNRRRRHLASGLVVLSAFAMPACSDSAPSSSPDNGSAPVADAPVDGGGGEVGQPDVVKPKDGVGPGADLTPLDVASPDVAADLGVLDVPTDLGTPDALIDLGQPDVAPDLGTLDDAGDDVGLVDETSDDAMAPDSDDTGPDAPDCVPTGIEVCDGFDNDCNGDIDDGLGQMTCGVGKCAHLVTACVDGKVGPCDPKLGFSSEQCNGEDDDCNGQIDDELGTVGCGKGACAHTVPACAGGQPSGCDPMAGSGPETCNALDDDCDGDTDEGLGTTLCGKGECEHEVPVCLSGQPGACDPKQGAALEVCDGLDNDCDGTVDAGDGLDVTTPEHCGACDRSCKTCAANCLDSGATCTAVVGVGVVLPTCGCTTCAVGYFNRDGDETCETYCVPVGTTDVTCDGQDDDCDGLVDEDMDLCSLASCGACGKVCNLPHANASCLGPSGAACAPGTGVCGIATCVCTGAGDCWSDQDGIVANGCEYACHPTGPELCDGQDNDCNGTIDDQGTPADPAVGGACNGDARGECAAAATAGTLACRGGVLVCEGATVRLPGQVSETCNGKDDDCDGQTDEAAIGAGGPCGLSSLAPCHKGALVCELGALVCKGAKDPGIEVCNDIDDNCDGQIDLTNGLPPTDAVGPCSVPAPPPPGAASPCKAGTLACASGALVCQDAKGPTGSVDACGVDSNCDGTLTGQPDLSSNVAHCGACGQSCYANAVHSLWACNGGCQFAGCEPGYYDLDGNDTCEYPCVFISASESCNGADDNCNGQIDENVVAPTPTQVCGVAPEAKSAECTSGVTVSCTKGAWKCAFPSDVCNPTCATASEVCDALDNDCNGLLNENVPNFGKACASDDGVPPPGHGKCRGTGHYVCAGLNSIQCNASKVDCNTLPGGCTELCDGIDNDCDGIVDEPFNNKGTNPAYFVKPVVTKVAASLWMMSYEASRATADSTAPGSGNGYASSAPTGVTLDKTRACSVPNRVPWFNVTPTEAAQVCGAMGGALCTTTQWQSGCKGSADTCQWAYVSACSTPATATKFCNLSSTYDASDASGDQDVVLVTASQALAGCYANWSGVFGNTTPTNKIFDLTGNVREIVATGAANSYAAVGGGYLSGSEAGAMCLAPAMPVGSFGAASDLGFRCCFTSDPTL